MLTFDINSTRIRKLFEGFFVPIYRRSIRLVRVNQRELHILPVERLITDLELLSPEINLHMSRRYA